MGHLDETRVAEKLREASAIWPFVTIGLERFRSALEASLEDGEASLDAIHTNDVYLALGCLEGQPEAVAAFERQVIAAIRGSVLRAAREPADADDALQTTREKLLVGSPGEGPKLAQYTGRGSLVGWVRVVAVREVLQAQRKSKRERVMDDAALVEGGSSAASFELARLRDLHADAFRSAVQQALRGLTAEQRAILRFYTKDRLSIDQLAPMLGVHRATAARRLEKARTDALDATRAILREHHGLSESEARSLCLALASEVDVSIGRALSDEVTQ